MKLQKLKDILEAEVLWGDDYLYKAVEKAYGSDLMSDVLALAESGVLLLTGLTNPQVVRTAEMAEIAAVCFVSGKKPREEAIELAKARDIPLLATRYSMYETCGRLYKEGLRGL